MMKSQEDVKEDLIHFLQKAVRDLQKEYVRNREIIPSSELTNSLCYALEAVFLHGLIGATLEKTSSFNFWPTLSKHTHKSTLADIDSLSQIKTDIGRCRVWIRLALNGCELESYIRLILADASALRHFYEPCSFILDVERVDLFLTSIQGLECIRFRLGHNSTVLNDWSNISLSLAGLATSANLPPNLSPVDLSGVNSFDDYELSPDDREEVRLMFRFENGLSPSNNGTDEAEEGQRKVQSVEANEGRSKVQPAVATRTDVSFPSGLENIDRNGLLEKNREESVKRSVSLGIQQSSVECTTHRSQSVSDSTLLSEHSNGRMTDEMRDLRFNQIVKENLEKYPLDYDRLRLQKEAETLECRKERSKGFSNTAPKENGFPCTHSPGSVTSHCLSCSDSSTTEPDAFWSTLHDEQWNEMEAGLSGGSSAGDGTPVLGNSLPRDSWISPPVESEFSGAPTFPANFNDHVCCELEASYGTILSDYKKSMPTQLKMVTAEGVLGLLSERIDGSSCTNGVESTKKSMRQSQKPTGIEIEGDWVVIDEDCPFTAEPYHIDSSCGHLLPFVTSRFMEKSLDDQEYKCRGCSKEISPGRGRWCNFDGYCYCSHCLHNETFYIPSQIIYTWDFKKLRVSTENLKFLKKIYDWPLLNIQELNPELYQMSDELNLVRDLRRQSYYLAGYMFHCSSPYSVRYWRAMNARLYYFSHIDNYSVKDLVSVHCGSFRKALQKINDSAMKHVYECKGCSVRGYYCEICQEPKVIYPFEINKTLVCDRCRNTYHKQCKLSQELACPKCNRIQVREATSLVDPMDLVMFTHPADMADLQP